MKKRIKELQYGEVCNIIVFLLGLCMVLFALICKNYKQVNVIFLSIGTSIMATAIVTYINAKYIVNQSKVKQIINKWGLQNIYETKSEMNKYSNEYLENCEKEIDIIAIGMKNFLSTKGDLLEELVKKGINIRIISCLPNSKILQQRERDESRDYMTNSSGNVMNSDILELNRWVKELQNKKLRGTIEIRFYKSYPGFSYLRIDKNLFWSDNLCLRPSQQSPAIEFKDRGLGYTYYKNYFEKIWGSEICTDNIDFRDNSY